MYVWIYVQLPAAVVRSVGPKQIHSEGRRDLRVKKWAGELRRYDSSKWQHRFEYHPCPLAMEMAFACPKWVQLVFKEQEL